MDIPDIEKRLESGELLKVKYRYPAEPTSSNSSSYGVRSDKLVDVSREHERLYALFQGKTAIWIPVEEVLEVLPDDGRYEDFPVR